MRRHDDSKRSSQLSGHGDGKCMMRRCLQLWCVLAIECAESRRTIASHLAHTASLPPVSPSHIRCGVVRHPSQCCLSVQCPRRLRSPTVGERFPARPDARGCGPRQEVVDHSPRILSCGCRVLIAILVPVVRLTGTHPSGFTHPAFIPPTSQLRIF
jgi:hypothetical protein